MRKQNREITDIDAKLAILKKCDTVRLALFDKEYPYIIPLNFGFLYEKGVLTLYFHGAKEGKKIDLINNNNKAAFECDCNHRLITAETACGYTMEYESICGFGDIEIINGEEKVNALSVIMKQYCETKNFNYDTKIVEMTNIFKLTVKEFTAKKLKKM